MNENKQFYNAEDIMRITGLKKTSSYEIINDLQDQLKKENPDYRPTKSIIPKEYFEKTILGKRVEI